MSFCSVSACFFSVMAPTISTHFLCFVQSSECEWIAVLRVTRGTHQFSLDFLSKWLEISLRETSHGFESYPLRPK